MIIRNDHFFLTSASEMKEISKPLLSLGIKYFSYGRHYNDGGRIWLCNTPENIEHYYSNNLYRYGNSEAHPTSYQSQIVLWSTLPNQGVFEFVRQRNIGDGIFIINPKKEYCEFLAFALEKPCIQNINAYLTYLESFKKFGDYFKQTANNLIKQGELNKIYLPYHNNTLPSMQDPDLSALLNISANLKLAPRQYQCARLLLQGKNTKEIAKECSLSPRTVESYINNLKTKFRCLNKTELLFKLSDLLNK